jgi:hypothetical protein
LDGPASIEGHDGKKLMEGFEVTEDDVGDLDRRRECPVPKPKGMIGELLGFAIYGSGKDSVKDEDTKS